MYSACDSHVHFAYQCVGQIDEKTWTRVRQETAKVRFEIIAGAMNNYCAFNICVRLLWEMHVNWVHNELINKCCLVSFKQSPSKYGIKKLLKIIDRMKLKLNQKFFEICWQVAVFLFLWGKKYAPYSAMIISIYRLTSKKITCYHSSVNLNHHVGNGWGLHAKYLNSLIEKLHSSL